MKTTIARLWLPFKQALSIAASKQGRQQILRTPLYANSIYLVANSVITCVLGFAFWLAVARVYESDQVGQGSAIISMGAFLSFLGTLGLASGLIRFLPGAGERATKLINYSLSLSVMVAAAVAIIFLVGMPLWAPTLMFIRENVVFMLAFIVLVVGGTIVLVINGVFVGLRRASFVAAQNGLHSVLKLILAITLAIFFGTFGIVGSWTVGQCVAIVLSLFLFLPLVQPGYRPVPGLSKDATKEIMRFSLANYIADGLWSMPTWLLPLLVINTLGSQANAHFYMSWTMSALLSAIATGTSLSLFAEGSHDQNRLKNDLGKSLKLAFIMLLPGIAFMLLAGSTLLLAYGSEYSTTGTRLLWILTLASLPMSVNYIYLSVLKVQKRFGEMVLVTGTVAGGTLGLSSILLLSMGIEGAGIAWLVTHTLLALVVVTRLKKIVSDKSAEISAAK